jgi:hypothetical protein
MRFHRIAIIIITVSLLAAMFMDVSVLAAWPYPGYPSFVASFKALATSYPQFVSYQTIGKTVLGQDILMFRIGNPAGDVVLFDGDIHGYESEGSQLLFYYTVWLLNSGDPLAQHVLANTCTLIVPVVNVDDYSLNRTNAHGVDLNRNFATNWQYGGSADPISENYRGPSPLSEPESQALEEVFQTYKPSAYVNVHDGGGEMLYESSYTNSTYLNTVLEEISSLSSRRGATPYSLNSIISFPGAAMTDVVTKGGARISLLLELGNATRTLSEVNSSVLPRFIPIAAVLSQESESNASNALFTDGFELGDFSSWDGNQTTPGEALAVTNSLSRQGLYSAFFTSNDDDPSGTAYCYQNLQASASLSARGYFLATSFVATANYSRLYFAAFIASGQTVAMAGVMRSGDAFWWRLAVRNGTNWVIIDLVAASLLNQWHRFELQWAQSPTVGYGKLYVDGTLVCSVSAINTTAYGAVNSAEFGIAMSGGSKTALYLDYIQLSTDSLGPLPIPADLNQDGEIDVQDQSIGGRAFGSTIGSPNWNPLADLNADGKVDIRDLAMVAMHFGEQYA